MTKSNEKKKYQWMYALQRHLRLKFETISFERQEFQYKNARIVGCVWCKFYLKYAYS
jgi:hypothetical protein